MKRVTILAQGRQKDTQLGALCADYYRRCSRRMTVEEKQVRDLAALKAALPDRGVIVALDERGQQLTSRAFARRLQTWLEGPFPQLVFVIGGADGLDQAVRQRADLVLSLGPMTLAHRLVRVIWAEQLYRAVSIIDGAPYHRD